MSLDHVVRYCEINNAIFHQRAKPVYAIELNYCPFQEKHNCKYNGIIKTKIGNEYYVPCMKQDDCKI